MSSRNLVPGLFLLVMASLFLGILYETTFFGGAANSGATNVKENDPLEQARETLEHDADVNACRAALQQVNLALGARSDLARPPALDAKDQERLKRDFGLSDDDLSELRAESYTQLDGWHLGGAFLFHDAATHALEPEEVGVALPAPSALERATAAFAWSVRQVRLADPTIIDPVPPQFALRRGSGTPLERALVFLDLLDQLGASGPEAAAHQEGVPEPPPALLGCLVALRDKPGEPSRLWACGVVVNGGPDLYLFDPRLGLPVPGEDGNGVATLSDVCRKPALLDALKIEGAPAYDVTGVQARSAELQLVCSLSSLAPRMEHLQKKLLPPVHVSLCHNLDRELGLLRTVAAKTQGGEPVVKVWTEGVGLLRRFLSPDEGGADTGWPKPGFLLRSLVGFTNQDDTNKVQMKRQQLFRLQLAPWDVMPPQFHDLNKFPYNVGLGLRVREGFLMPFDRIALAPQGPRDRLLRGDFDKAAADLVSFSARMEQYLKRRAEAGTDGKLEKAVDEWVEKARHAYADQLRAQEKGAPAEMDAANKAVDAVWGQSAEPVRTLLEGASAVPGIAEVTYQLGLCKHEKAEQAQTRLELLTRRPGETLSPLDTEDVRTAWMDALGWWKKYGDDHPEESAERPSSCPGRAAAVRQMRGRAQAMIGDWQAAAATYDDMTEPMSDLEKLAARFRARQLKKEHGAAKP
jgi:hypothetical protein